MSDSTILIIQIATTIIVPIIVGFIAARPGIKALRSQDALRDAEKKKLEDDITKSVLDRADKYIANLEKQNKEQAEKITKLVAKVNDLEVENDDLRGKYAELETKYQAALLRIEKLEKGDTGPLTNA